MNSAHDRDHVGDGPGDAFGATVERLFAEITRQKIRRGVFKSVDDLIVAIEAWISNRNAKPRPFKWTAKADTILDKSAHARRTLTEVVSAGTK